MKWRGIVISLRKYILDLHEETKKLGAKAADASIEQNHGLHLESGELKYERMYQELVGKLINLTITIPGISYAISLVS